MFSQLGKDYGMTREFHVRRQTCGAVVTVQTLVTCAVIRVAITAAAVTHTEI